MSNGLLWQDAKSAPLQAFRGSKKARLVPGLQAMNQAMLARLAPDERAEFMRLLAKFVAVNNDQSRAPLGGKGDTA